MKSIKEYFVYIIRLSNGHLYTGYTDDVMRRMMMHRSGKGSKCARAFPPVRIERVWRMDSRSAAMRLEAMIKKLSREQKDRIILKNSILAAIVKSDDRSFGDIKVMRQFTGKSLDGVCVHDKGKNVFERRFLRVCRTSGADRVQP
ncbi:MAG TPA: GIY-YIG nuclease family protein [Spirochaetota bacterium]